MFGRKQEKAAPAPPAPAPAETASAPSAEAAQRPLFYRRPAPLSASAHGALRMRARDLSFAAETIVAPLVATEFLEAARRLPIVFTHESAHPMALLGLEEGRNLFLQDGQWLSNAYIPAYVRRYPFVFIAGAEEGKLALGVDMESDCFSDTGEPLFEDDKPSPLTQRALEFCAQFQADAALTRSFSAALIAEGLLVNRRADIVLPDGRSTAIDGFKIIDGDAFNNLSDATMLEWRRKGWIGLVHYHWTSLGAVRDLLALNQRIAA